MMRRIALLLGWILAALSGAHATPLERDVGHGLAYVRVHGLPADLPAKRAGRAPPCIIDVRYVNGAAEEAMAFHAWLKERATARTPVFVLANSATSSDVLKAVAGFERNSGVVVVGLPGRGFRPDVAVKTTEEIEREAYDALEKGEAIAKLLADNPDKVRNDEASLSKDRLAEASADAADDSVTGKRGPPPIDATLQRAVHLHRALVALKKL